MTVVTPTAAGAFLLGTATGFLAGFATGIAAALGMVAAIERGVTVSPENGRPLLTIPNHVPDYLTSER